MDYHIENIRLLLYEAFSDEDLRSMSYDIASFRDVYDQLTSDSRKSDVVELVVEAALHHAILDRMLTWTKGRHPVEYAKYEPYRITDSGPSTTRRQPATPNARTAQVNPFTYGNAISNPDRFVGRQREIEQIYSRLHNAEFESSAIVGERRIGKTSLLKYLARREVTTLAGFPADRYVFVYIDLQIIGPNKTPSDFWQRILRAIKRRIHDEELKELIDEVCREKIIDAFILDDLFTLVDDLGLHIVLLLDEFERVTQNQAFDVDFFSGLRATAIHHNLALIPSSRKELIELTHSKAVQDSPFFNIFSNVTLRPFSEGEVETLLETYLAGHAISFTPEEIGYIWEMAGPHPYFLQMICYLLYEAYEENKSPQQRRRYVDEMFYAEVGAMFSVYWQHSSANQQILLVVMALRALARGALKQGDTVEELKQFYHRAERTVLALDKRGLILDDDSLPKRYRPFSLVFCDWVADDLVAGTGDATVWLEWQQENATQLGKLPLSTQQRVLSILPRLNSAHTGSIGHWLFNRSTVNQAVRLLEDFLHQYKQTPGQRSPSPEHRGQSQADQPDLITPAGSEMRMDNLVGRLASYNEQLDRLNLRAARYSGRGLPADLERQINDMQEKIKDIEERLRQLMS